MTVLSEDNVVQIKMSFLIWFCVIIFSVFSALFGWQQIQLSNMKDNIKDFEDNQIAKIYESIGENGDKIYVIQTTDLPNITTLTSVQQSQLNTIFTVLFGKPVESNFNTNSPTLPTRGN